MDPVVVKTKEKMVVVEVLLTKVFADVEAESTTTNVED